MSVAQLLNLWTIPWAVQMHSKEMCREAKIHTCLPFTLVYSGPQPWWYSALRSQSCRYASADVWAKGKERDFNESSANQSSMAEALHRFQHDGICASLLCNVSTYPVTQSPQKNSVLGVRGSSLPLLWTFSASTSLCDQDGFYDLFAPFAKAVLMQSLHLSQLGSVGTSVLSFFSSHSIALQWDKWPFHSIFTESTPFFLLPDSPPPSPWHPQAWGHLWHKQSLLGTQHTATAPWPTCLSWAFQSPWWPPQKLIPC